MRKDLHEENRLSWNAATRAHNSHKRDQAAHLRSGGSTLFSEERDLLGDLRGVKLLHLQCNAGQDSLSLARLGAEVTGVDISDEAIAFARRLSEDAGIPTEFQRADVFDWLKSPSASGRQFDVVFCSYGAVCWISDLTAWAKGIEAALRSGGRFVAVEYHPVAMIFDEQLNRKYSYFGGGAPLTWPEGVRDYVAESGAALTPSGFEEGVTGFQNPHRVHEFQWSIGETVTAILEAGLSLEIYREYPYSNGAALFAGMTALPERRYGLPDGLPSLPLMYGLTARKP